MNTISIVDNPQDLRYELRVDGAHAGRVEYLRDEDVVTVTHVVVSEDFAGRGLAARLVEFVLDDLRAHGLRLLPRCPYTRAYLRKHPQQLDLVPSDRQAEFGLP